MSDFSVSDVDPDDLDQMIKGIDDFDDDLFGKSKSKQTSQSKQPQPSKPAATKSQEKRVQFDEENKDKAKEVEKPAEKEPTIKPISKKIDFDDDDILAPVDKKKSSKSVMDDLFGSSSNKE